MSTDLIYEVALEDYKGDTITTDSTDDVQFTLNPVPPGSVNAMLTNGVTKLRMGIASNSTTSAPLYINALGTFTLTVTEIPSSPGEVVANPGTSKEFKVS